MMTRKRTSDNEVSNAVVEHRKPKKQITDTSNMGIKYILPSAVEVKVKRRKNFTKVDYGDVKVEKSRSLGDYLVANTDLPKNSILPYGGEVVHSAQIKDDREQSGLGNYFVKVNNAYLDGNPNRISTNGFLGNPWPGIYCNEATGKQEYNCFIDRSFKWGTSVPVPVGCNSSYLIVIRVVSPICAGEPFFCWYGIDGINNETDEDFDKNFKRAFRRGYCPAVPTRLFLAECGIEDRLVQKSIIDKYKVKNKLFYDKYRPRPRVVTRGFTEPEVSEDSSLRRSKRIADL